MHVPLAKKLTELRKYEVSQGPILSPSGHSEIYFLATLYFDSLDAIKTAYASEVGGACKADRKILVPDENDVQVYLLDTNEM